MIKKLLVATDGSDHAKKAIEYACDFGSKYGASIDVIHVVSPPPIVYSEASFEPLVDYAKRAGRTILEEAEKTIRRKGVEQVETFLAEGDPAQEIIRHARENHVDMIFLGSRGAGRIGALMLGTVSHKVCNMAEATCVTVK
ncbi:MAG: universal stress protein [Deltaproteobacteria bacterium]|nr:universal stress protein [Deltaproteobacteria bacterium]MBW2121678.1 universal stress protein [Deltaproteobacteria bacterium]